jgi:hypothetical protein
MACTSLRSNLGLRGARLTTNRLSQEAYRKPHVFAVTHVCYLRRVALSPVIYHLLGLETAKLLTVHSQNYNALIWLDTRQCWQCGLVQLGVVYQLDKQNASIRHRTIKLLLLCSCLPFGKTQRPSLIRSCFSRLTTLSESWPSRKFYWLFLFPDWYVAVTQFSGFYL